MNAQIPVGTEVALRKPAEIRPTHDATHILDTAKFEHMQRIANVMASSTLIPESLWTDSKGEQLDDRVVAANCFLVVNQAARWGMDPFAVAQCVSVVHGKLCYEGKLIAAVIDAKVGIRLRYVWDEKPGDQLGIEVIGKYADEAEARSVKGTVGEWKTTHKGSPWTLAQSRKMLAYRGAREWARLHAPGIMLGVYSDDEMAALSEDLRAARATDVTPLPRSTQPDDLPPNPDEVEGSAPKPKRTPKPKPEPKPEEKPVVDADVQRVEAGRDNGEQVVWGDDEPPPPDAIEGDIPPSLDRTADPAKPLLDEIAGITAMVGLEELLAKKGYSERRAALSQKDQGRVHQALQQKLTEIRPA